MSNELKYTYAAAVTLEDNGATLVASAMGVADSAILSAGNHSDYPMGDFALKCSFGTAVGANVAVYLFRQDKGIDGANDAPAPTASAYEQVLVGIFPLPATAATATAYYPCTNVPLSRSCAFSIRNGTAQNLNAGWSLKCTPKSYVPGA